MREIVCYLTIIFFNIESIGVFTDGFRFTSLLVNVVTKLVLRFGKQLVKNMALMAVQANLKVKVTYNLNDYQFTLMKLPATDGFLVRSWLI
jgi:hypothetical protein